MSGSVATLPVAFAPIAADGTVFGTAPSVPVTTAVTQRICITAATSRVVSTEPFAVCPPNLMDLAA